MVPKKTRAYTRRVPHVAFGFHFRAERSGRRVRRTIWLQPDDLSNAIFRKIGVQSGARGRLVFLRFVEVQIRHVIAGPRQRAGL
jgi:hypothetical protein